MAVRALIAHTNRGGEPKLRDLEMRFLQAGITVGRTAEDLIRYHGKMMIVDRRTLFLLSFNFVHMDIDHSRAFGIITDNAKVVQEAVTLFEADLNRQAYTAGSNMFVVSPLNARAQLSAFIKQARKQLLIYDPKVADKGIRRLLDGQAKAGVDVRIIGSIEGADVAYPVSKLNTMRLHTRTIIRDGTHAFVGSQSLRQPELDSRREIGIIVQDANVVRSLSAIFEQDWTNTGYDEARATGYGATAQPELPEEAARVLAKEIPRLKSSLKKAIQQAVEKAGPEVLADEATRTAIKDTMKSVAKSAIKEAVKEMGPSEVQP